MPRNREDVVISSQDLSSVWQLQQPIFSYKVLLLNIFFLYLFEFPDPSYLSCPIWDYTADGSCSHTLFCPTNKPSVSSPVLLWQMGPFSYTLRLSIKPWREREVVEREQGNVPMSLSLHEKAKRESSASVYVCYRQIEKEKKCMIRPGSPCRTGEYKYFWDGFHMRCSKKRRDKNAKHFRQRKVAVWQHSGSAFDGKIGGDMKGKITNILRPKQNEEFCHEELWRKRKHLERGGGTAQQRIKNLEATEAREEDFMEAVEG